MDEGTAITRNKRPRSSGETSNSFIQNVTSTVSNIFSPFVKWLNSPSASTDNDPSQKVDATDSSSEEEISPPTKKMCYNSTENSNHIGQSGVFYSTSNIGAKKSPVKNLKKDLHHVSTSNHSITKELPEDNNEGDYKNINFNSPQFIATTSRQSVIKKRKSLFNTIEEKSSDLSKNKKTANAVKDSYGSINETSLGSPFYPGKTSYGGASACYMNQLNVDVCKSPINNSDSRFDDSCMSQSAKRIMKLLEDCSSPLSEARSISQFIESKNHDNLNTTTQSNKIHSYKTQELHIPSIASILLLEKKNKISNLMDTKNHVHQILASHSSTIRHEPYPHRNIQSEFSKRNIDKYITKITRNNMGHKCINTPVELPPAVLEIHQSNLANLDFGIATNSEDLNSSVAISVAKSVKNTSIISSDNNINDEADQNINMEKQIESKQPTNNYQYQFSMPLVALKDTLSSSVPKTLLDNPQQNKEKTEVIMHQDFSVPTVQPLEIDNKLVKQKLEEWKCSDCWVHNKVDTSNCVCCSAMKPVEENKTSLKCSRCKREIHQDTVGNLCSKCETAEITSSNQSLLPLPSQEKLSWKCNDCWVKNDALAEKCICCGGKRPEAKDNENKTNEQKFSDNRDNKNSTFNTCGEVRPEHNFDNIPVTLPAPNNDISIFKIQDNVYENILKAQSNMWECSYCLANNDNNASKCICCEAGKPNSENTKIKKFNFNTSTTFKFGIDHNAKCNSSKNIEAEQMSINEEWETNNNVLAKTASFNFGSPKITEDKNENFITNNLNKAPEVPKLNFKFGISKESSIDQAKSSNLLNCDGNQEETEFTLTSTPKYPDVSKQNMEFLAVQDVLTSDNVPQDSMLTIPLSSSTSIEKQLNPILDDVVRHTSIEDKNFTFKPITIETIENNEVNTPNDLNFCNSRVRIATNLYNTQSVTETIAVTSVNSLISSPMTNTVSLLETNNKSSVSETPMFQKMNTIPMFQITETSKPTETTLPHSSSKLFNFGHSNKNLTCLPESLKFNFSFGNVKKTESPQLFSTTFDVTNNSNPLMNSNNFAFTTANMVGTNLSLPVRSLDNENINTGNSITNNLPGPNGIPTANPLGITESSMSVGQNVKLSNNLPTTVPMFGETLQKDNLWTNTKNNPTTLFVTNINTNTIQRTPTFSFGIPTPLEAKSNGPIFGNSIPNAFLTQNRTSSLPSLFQNPNSNPSTTNIFGNIQSHNVSVSLDGAFHNSDMSVVNNFSVPSPTMPTFETPSQISRPTQSFNFGTPQQQTSGVFGFGQQPVQSFQNTVYNFGSTQNTPQFTMGSSHNTSVRRVRKAVRRSTQR